MFATRQLSVRYPHAQLPAITDITLTIQPASFFAVIGPNGSGKSTLLRTLLGGIAPASGHAEYEGRAVSEWARLDFARRIGAVTQVEEMPFPVTVRALVAMGRYPHLGPLQAEREEDRAAILHAMQRCDVAQLATRSMDTLSGGERQRARIARALAQSPETLVLDEPTAALDIAHEMAVFELLRSLVDDERRTVIVATHHINLAARFADALLLLDRGRVAAVGTAAAVMMKETLESVYAWPIALHEHAGSGFDRGAPQVTPLSRTEMESR